MANWGSTTVNSTFDANTAARTAMDTRSASRSGASVTMHGATNGLWGTGLGANPGQSSQSMSGLDVVGINATKVPEMREQIRSSVQALQTYLDGIDAETNSAAAFRSDEVKTAVENYVLSVKDYSKALISDLLAFSDKLQSVRDAWEQSTSSFANDSVSTSTSQMKDASTYYTETL